MHSQKSAKDKQDKSNKQQSTKQKHSKSKAEEDIVMKDDENELQSSQRSKRLSQRTKEKNIESTKLSQSSKLKSQKPQTKVVKRKEDEKKEEKREHPTKKQGKKNEDSDEEMEDVSGEKNQQSEKEEEKNENKTQPKTKPKIEGSRKGKSNNDNEGQIKQRTSVGQTNAGQYSINLFKLIIKDASSEIGKRIKFQGIKEVNSQNQMCHICFQYVEYPSESKSEDDESQEDEDKEPELFYALVYCYDCQVPVHWNCLGEKQKVYEHQVREQGKLQNYLVFKCQKCEVKSQNKLLNPKICAMLYPEYFFLHDPTKMNFKLKEKPDLNIEQKPCFFCKSSKGLLKQCCSQECDQYAHGYCIVDKLKDYQYDWSDKDCPNPDANHPTKWMYQLCYEPNKKEISTKIFCHNHQLQTYYCYCLDQSDNSVMIMCDYCLIWYHRKCVKDEVDNEGEDDESLMCQKCKEWRQMLDETLIDIVLRKKNYDELLNDDKTDWSFQSLIFNTNRCLFTEAKIFEQILFTKSWYILAHYLLKNECTEDQIDKHIDLHQKLFVNCWYQNNQLKKKIDNGTSIIKELVQKLGNIDIKDAIDENNEVISENLQSNSKVREQIQKTIKQALSQSKLKNNDIKELQKKEQQLHILNDLGTVFADKKSKPDHRTVKEWIEQMDQLGMQNLQSYKLIHEINQEYDKWEESSLYKFYESAHSENQITLKLRNLKSTKTGTKLQEARYKYFKELFNNKMLILDGMKIVEDGQSLRVDISEEINQMSQLVANTEKTEKEMLRIEQSNKKPVQNMFSALIQAASYPLRTKNMMGILEKWYNSACWNSTASQFVKDKLRANLAYAARNVIRDNQDDRMEIDEGSQAVNESDFIWKLEDASKLLKATDNIYYDLLLYNQVKEKIAIVDKLKKALPSILSQKHDIKLLKDYVRELKDIENVDFKYEIQQTQKKINLITEVKQVVESDGKTKYSVDYLEHLVEKINELSSQPVNPITLELDMTMMLKAKVKIAQDLKKEFYDILDQNQDTFSKQMHAELKKIIRKANKEHFIEMKEEQNILNNVPASEEWFLATYDKLKKIAGKMLNQVDFKNFTQLSTVVHEEKEVESLLKSKMPSDQLVGAAKSLWRSLSGVKWLLELRKLIQQSETQQVEMKVVEDMDERAKALGIDYAKEIAKENIYERHFVQFSKLVESISMFEEKFGTRKKQAKTLDEKYEEMVKDESVVDEFQKEVQSLTETIQNHKITSQSGELEVLSKLHTWIEFLRDYKKLADQFENKLPYEQAMILSQQAREKAIPDEIRVLKELNERVRRFEKFNRDYNDYKRFRERIKKQGYSLSQGILDVRFTCYFLQKLIEESKNLSIDQSQSDDFDEQLLESDLTAYDQWRNEADELLATLEEDELSLSKSEIRDQFMSLKNQMRLLPVYDKDLFMKVQVYDWLFSVLDMLESQHTTEPKPIGTWEGKVRQGDQFLNVMKNLKNHSIYQRILWEIEQAKQVNDFVNTQKTNQKSLAAKFNMDKTQNYAFFRNKHPRSKLQKMLDNARQCKVDVVEEVRCLDQWIKDYDKYTQLHEEGKLTSEFQFDKLRDIVKQMYLSPIDYGDVYFKLKDKIDTAEMIKLNLKRIFQEYEDSIQIKMKENQQVKRLRISRIAYDLKLYHKSCNIKGVKEIDIAIEKVQKSKEKLKEVVDILNEIQQLDSKTQSSQIKEKLEQAKIVFSQVELDMEQEEIDIRRQIFETELRMVFNSSGTQKLQYEEFKDFDREYDKLRNSLKDDTVHGKFIKIKSKVQDIVREINKAENEQDLNKIQERTAKDCPEIDFTQLLTDKDAELILGKRTKRESEKRISLDLNDEDLQLGPNKRLKGSQDSFISGSQSKQEQSESEESGSESGSSSSSGSDSSDDESGSSSSGSESDSESGSDESSEESEEESLNIAKNRSRRNIVPNMKADYIYAKPSVKAMQRMQTERNQNSQEEESKDLNEEEKEKREQERKRNRKLEKKRIREQKRKEREKKLKMQKQLREYRLQQNKTQSTIQNRQKLASKLDPDQPISLSSQIALDKGLQDSLQIIKTKIRDQSRQRVKDVIEQTPVFSSMTSEQQKEFIIKLETDVFTKNPEVDHYYRKKITDACENIKFLTNHKDIAELIVKKSIQLYRLLQPHPQFKDYVNKIIQGIKEKKQQLKLEQRQQKKKQQQMNIEKSKEVDNEVVEPAEQQMMKVLYSGNAKRSTDQQQFSQEQRVKTSESDDDDIESMDSNPALFSDEEEVVGQQQVAGHQYDPYQTTRDYSQQQINQGMYGDFRGYNQSIFSMGIPHTRVQYNPYEILEQRVGRFTQKKPTEPVMYDPMKDKGQLRGPQQKNVAPPGSLLKVWEGQLELSKDQQPSCKIYSTTDIQVFQLLPELPQTLQLKGKAKIADVTSHFLRLRKERKLIKGWVVRRGNIGNVNGGKSGTTNWQENSDKYTKLFDELEAQDKAALFNVFQGVTFYMVPITSKTKEFCKQMGIQPESISNLSSEDKSDLSSQLSQETHCYALLSQIKQQFNNKLNFCNPQVLRVAEVPVKPLKADHVSAKDRSFSPITSDEEDNVKDKHKAQVLQQVKTEEFNQQQQQELVGGNLPQQQLFSQQRVMVKQDEQQDVTMREQQAQIKQGDEEGDDVDIDGLIMKFKTEGFDINSIQAQLMPIIHKVKGEKEVKLTQFLQELIASFNNPQPSQPLIKQETPMMPQNQSLGYGQGASTQYVQQPSYMTGQQHSQSQQRFPSQIPQNQFMPQQSHPQFRGQVPQQQMMGAVPISQQQIRPPMPQQQIGGGMYPTSQMGMPMQNPQMFAPRQGFPPQIQSQPQIYQQQGQIPQLRPPPGMQGNQMIRPPPMGIPQQQQFGNMPPGMMGMPYQQQQQTRYPNPNQKQQQKR